jgi:hypothetical protein
MISYPAQFDLTPFMSHVADKKETVESKFVYKLFGLVVHEGRGL